MIELKIGGVPEHFNLPWRLSLEGGAFGRAGVKVEWRDYPGGSGAMAKALRDGELDAALLLTEGAVAAVTDGVALEIVSLYTDSPLVWGIHVPAQSRFKAVADLEEAAWADAQERVAAEPLAALDGLQQVSGIAGIEAQERADRCLEVSGARRA